MSGRVRFRVATSGRGGAIGVVEVRAGGEDALGAALRGAGMGGVGAGAFGVRDLCGVDRGVVARWGGGFATLMPHGGRVVMERLAGALRGLGWSEDTGDAGGVMAWWPEAGDLVEACVLEAVSWTESRAAVGALAKQRGLWRDGGRAATEDEAARLGRLLEPAVVAAVGAANVGKSSLLNALASEDAALVHDEPGTTRDAVGALVELDGVVVRWVDTPGVRRGAGGVEREAWGLAAEVVSRADVVVVCGDGASGWRGEDAAGAGSEVVRCATRVDLRAAPGGADVETSARTGEGVGVLAREVRERLVPGALLADPPRWAFHPALSV